MKNFTEIQVSHANIKNIIFDLGGVIINIDWQLSINAFLQLVQPQYRNQYQDLIQNGTYKEQFFVDYEIGKIDDATFCQKLRETFHIEAAINNSQIITAWNALLMDIPNDRVELLRNLGTTHRTFVLRKRFKRCSDMKMCSNYLS